MDEDILPLLGHNIGAAQDSASDSDTEDGESGAEPMEEGQGEGHDEGSGEGEGQVEAPAEEEADIGQGEVRPRRGLRLRLLRRQRRPERQPPRPEDINFDSSLPGTHSYLGNDLEEVRGRTVHEDDSLQTVPILTLPGVVLVPGQMLPLHLFHPSTVAMMRRIVHDGDKTFGLVTSSYSTDRMQPVLSMLGTTAEVLYMKDELDDGSGIRTMRVKAMGRQRFQIQETQRRTDGINMAKVRILPERVLPEALIGARPPSHSKFCRCPVADEENTVIREVYHNYGMPEAVTVQTQRKMCREVGRHSCAHLTWWPPWVYRLYDPDLLMHKVRSELQSWNKTLTADKMPQDAIDFSYWVLGNLPISDEMRLKILRKDSCVQRLRSELDILQKCTVLQCKDCEHHIADKKDVFVMAAEGPMAAYVNPGGYVHETLTVYRARGLEHVGRPETENSWFPGYAWTIINCHQCGSHLGWRFTAVKKNLQPNKFWGLTRASIVPGLNLEEGQTSWEPMV